MPSGIYRGVIKRIDDDGLLYITIPNLNASIYGPVEPIPGITFFKDENVLCGFFEGGTQQLEVIRKAKTLGIYTELYEESY